MVVGELEDGPPACNRQEAVSRAITVNIGGPDNMTKRKAIEIQREFGRLMDRVLPECFRMNLDQAALLIDETASPLLKAASQEPDVLLELKRGVAENKFSVAYGLNRPLEEVERYYNAIRRLGFTNLELKANYTILFAQYCLRNGNEVEGTKLLRRLDRELSNHIVTYQYYKDNVETLLGIKENT